MARSMREEGQPTPKQVATDALRGTPLHELAETVPAQSPEDEEMMLSETLEVLKFYSGNEIFGEKKLEATVSGLFNVIVQAAERDGKDISHVVEEVYEPSTGRTLRRSPVPPNNHALRLVSPWEGILELRTGPFHDNAVNKVYRPELKVFLPREDLRTISNNNQAFAKAIRIVADVFPRTPELIRDLNRLVGN